MGQGWGSPLACSPAPRARVPEPVLLASRSTNSSGALAFPTLPVGAARPGHAVFRSPPLEGKSPPAIVEVKATAGKFGKEDRKGAAQEKKQMGIREKEDRKLAKLSGKEASRDITEGGSGGGAGKKHSGTLWGGCGPGWGGGRGAAAGGRSLPTSCS